MFSEELIEEGIVKEVKDRLAIININDSGSCEECSAKLFCNPSDYGKRSLTVTDPFGVHPGDKVRISIKGKKIIAVSLILYGFPLMLLLISIFLGMNLFTSNKEIFSSLLAIVSAGIYFLIIYFFTKSSKSKIKSYPEIVFVNPPIQ
jgi:positive regulator of sigma E activity